MLFGLSVNAFLDFVCILTIWASWEWGFIVGIENKLYRIGYIVVVLFFTLVSFQMQLSLVLLLGFVWWLLVKHYVKTYAKREQAWYKKISLKALMGLPTMIPCAISMYHVRATEQGSLLLLYFLILVCVADSGAYFGGRLWGKRKLAPEVSPGKTVEGMLCGVGLSIPIALISAVLWHLPLGQWFWWVIIALVTVLFSVLGDLYISMLKRIRGVKDTGTMLPGHGGLLDRIDGILAAMPIFALGLVLLGTLT